MPMNYKCFSMNLASFFYVEDGHYIIEDNDVVHDIFIKKSSKPNNNLIVFGQGAVDRSKVFPNFQRISWINDLDDNIIITNDPTLKLDSDLQLGWFQYSSKVNYFFRFAEMLKKVCSKMGFSQDTIIFYGSSAGGYVSLKLACYFPNSYAVVNNPQTDWTKFYEPSVCKLLSVSYKCKSVSEYKENYKNEDYVVDTFRRIGYVPKIFFLQNSHDQFHYVNHFLPFCNDITTKCAHMMKKVDFTINIYSNEYDGHNPLSKEDTIKYISFVRNQNYYSEYNVK